jgi:hypothetical protein
LSLLLWGVPELPLDPLELLLIAMDGAGLVIVFEESDV